MVEGAWDAKKYLSWSVALSHELAASSPTSCWRFAATWRNCATDYSGVWQDLMSKISPSPKVGSGNKLDGRNC